jgi:hypothetical protein
VFCLFAFCYGIFWRLGQPGRTTGLGPSWFSASLYDEMNDWIGSELFWSSFLFFFSDSVRLLGAADIYLGRIVQSTLVPIDGFNLSHRVHTFHTFQFTEDSRGTRPASRIFSRAKVLPPLHSFFLVTSTRSPIWSLFGRTITSFRLDGVC